MTSKLGLPQRCTRRGAHPALGRLHRGAARAHRSRRAAGKAGGGRQAGMLNRAGQRVGFSQG